MVSQTECKWEVVVLDSTYNNMAVGEFDFDEMPKKGDKIEEIFAVVEEVLQVHTPSKTAIVTVTWED